MDRRSFLKLFAAAGPVAVVAPKYFFAPVGGWKSDVIVHPRTATGAQLLMASNPSGPSWVKERFMSVDYGAGPSYSVYWLASDGRVLAFDGSEVQPMHTEWTRKRSPEANPGSALLLG